MSFSFSQHIPGGYANGSPQGGVKNKVVSTTPTSELIKHDVEMMQPGASPTGEQQTTVLSDADFDMHSAPRSATTAGPEKGSATRPNARPATVSSFPQNDLIHRATVPRPIPVRERNGTLFVTPPGSPTMADEQENTALPSPDFDMDISSTAMPIAGPNRPAFRSDAGPVMAISLPQSNLVHRTTAPHPIPVCERNGTLFVTPPGSPTMADEQENTALPSPDFDMDIPSTAVTIAGPNEPAFRSDAGSTIVNSLPQNDLAHEATIQPPEGHVENTEMLVEPSVEPMRTGSTVISAGNRSSPPHSDVDIVLRPPTLHSDQGKMPPLVPPLIGSKNGAEFLFAWNRQPKRHKKLASQQNATHVVHENKRVAVAGPSRAKFDEIIEKRRSERETFHAESAEWEQRYAKLNQTLMDERLASAQQEKDQATSHAESVKWEKRYTKLKQTLIDERLAWQEKDKAASVEWEERYTKLNQTLMDERLARQEKDKAASVEWEERYTKLNQTLMDERLARQEKDKAASHAESVEWEERYTKLNQTLMDERLARQEKDKAMTASFNNQMHELEAQLEARLHENETTETELTGQILQYEGEMEQLTTQNEDLRKELKDLDVNFERNLAHKVQEMVAARLPQPRPAENEALLKANEAMSAAARKAEEEKSDLQKFIAAMKLQFERDILQRDDELRAMRQKIHATTPLATQAPSGSQQHNPMTSSPTARSSPQTPQPSSSAVPGAPQSTASGSTAPHPQMPQPSSSAVPGAPQSTASESTRPPQMPQPSSSAASGADPQSTASASTASPAQTQRTSAYKGFQFARRSQRFNVLQSRGAAIGVVPLQPTPASQENETSDNGPTTSNLGPDVQTVETLTAAIGQALRNIGMGEIVSTKKCKKFTRNSMALSIKEQQAKMTDEDDKTWKIMIRHAWRETHGIRTASDFSTYQSAGTEEVAAFEDGGEGPGDTYKLDFNKGWERSRWNKRVLRKIYDKMVAGRTEDGGWGLPDVSEEYLIGELYGHLKRAREAWSVVKPRFQPSIGGIETPEALMLRVGNSSAKRMKAVSARARRDRKYERRATAVEQVIAIKMGDNAPDLAAWEYFRAMLEKLSCDGMSSEEEGTKKVGNVIIPIFWVKLCVWRAPEISDYLKYIDNAAENEAIRGTKGAKRSPRYISDQYGTSPPPNGLPRKMYNSAWLENEEKIRPGWVLDELRVSQEAFDLLSHAIRL